ncbi:hypothetical protein CgunFtcFv8_016506 [Champsocephalus gunnari]|uniref:Uncharacterized protein n=1 Tax=Champsocephalus gunnari TaxID=52237 RepID=A0AAN8CTV8_CHAGU|nr:hypothetical protein CgunFtcFv8_016506 [Champsocephalus gunnari]
MSWTVCERDGEREDHHPTHSSTATYSCSAVAMDTVPSLLHPICTLLDPLPSCVSPICICSSQSLSLSLAQLGYLGVADPGGLFGASVGAEEGGRQS